MFFFVHAFFVQGEVVPSQQPSDSGYDTSGAVGSTDDEQLVPSREERRGVIISSNRFLSIVLSDYLKSRSVATVKIPHVEPDLSNFKQALGKLAAPFVNREASASIGSATSTPQRYATILIDCEAFMKEQQRFGKLERAHLQSIIQFVEDCSTATSMDSDNRASSFSFEKFLQTESRKSIGEVKAFAKSSDWNEGRENDLRSMAAIEDFSLSVLLLTRYTTDVSAVLEKYPKVRAVSKPVTVDDAKRIARECGKILQNRLSRELKRGPLLDEEGQFGGGPGGDEGEERARTRDRAREEDGKGAASLALESLDEERSLHSLHCTIPRILVADDVGTAQLLFFICLY